MTQAATHREVHDACALIGELFPNERYYIRSQLLEEWLHRFCRETGGTSDEYVSPPLPTKAMLLWLQAFYAGAERMRCAGGK